MQMLLITENLRQGNAFTAYDRVSRYYSNIYHRQGINLPQKLEQQPFQNIYNVHSWNFLSK